VGGELKVLVGWVEMQLTRWVCLRRRADILMMPCACACGKLGVLGSWSGISTDGDAAELL
jgi:hypothetical protein